MKAFLPSIDEKKIRAIFEIDSAYKAGELSLAQAQARLKTEVKTVAPYELAYVEQQLKKFEEGQCQKEDIQAMLQLYEGILSTARPDLPEDHPILQYYRENDALRQICHEIEVLCQYPFIKNPWLDIYDKLVQHRLHLSRKQNQLYPLLEKKGFDRPTTTMWTLDDFIRDEITEFRALMDEDSEAFLEKQSILIADLLDLAQKEETVLYPTSLTMISNEEFEYMKAGDREIGYAWIEAALGQEPQLPAPTQAQGDLAAELSALLAKHGLGTATPGAALQVAQGELSLEQINLIYQHLPVDLSYVDENELVRFYSDTKERVFPRSRNVIGRNVMNCHPRKSAHVVREIIDAFRKGEKERAEFWINKPDIFIYIVYVAVRDARGQFRGVLEMMQDCTRIRALEGSRTLLTWEEESQSQSATPTEAPSAGQETADPPSAAASEGPSTAQPYPHEISAETRLADLLAARPELKQELPKLNFAFRMLQTPLARIMIPKATVRMMSEKSGMPLDELIASLKKLMGQNS